MSIVMEQLDDAFDWCRRFARSHTENFCVVTFLLPKQFRTPFYVLYSYCRLSDDLADETQDSELALARLDAWKNALQEAWKRSRIAHPDPPPSETHPVFIALEEIFRRFPTLTAEPFSDLLIAFRQDQVKKSYETYEELLGYCHFSANPVGRMILAVIKPESDAEDFRLADSLCTGLQLANFWQDVRRDGEIGRNYIPDEISDRYSSFREMMRDLCDDAALRLEAARPLVQRVRRSVRLDIRLFIEAGLAVLRAVQKVDYQVDQVRPTLSVATKCRLILKALFF